MHNFHTRQSALVLASLVALLGASVAHAASNRLANANFDTPSGTGPTTLMGQVASGPSAAANWLTYNNSNATTRTEQLPSTKVAGGTMLHVTTDGPYNGIYQPFNNADARQFVCAWIYVVNGNVALGAGNGPDTLPSAVLLKTGTWEVLNVSSATSPVTEAIVYSNGGAAEFYVESASVSSSQTQCKPQ